MNQRQLAVILLASVLAACGTPLENAASTFKEQVRLGDPDAQQTFSDNRELFESAEALPIWLDALENADSPQVQRWAATLIGNIGDASALPALATAMSSSRPVRDAAIDAIASFEVEEAAGAYAMALREGTRDAQAPALAALARMGADAASVVKAVATVAAADDSLIAKTAVNTLADIGTDGSAASLADLATNVALDMDRRRSAIQALQRIDSEAAAAQLAEIATVLADEEGADELRAAL